MQILANPKRDVLYQLGFDFYDAANDDKISEFDIYKVMQYYSKSPEYRDLFEKSIHFDIIVMLKIIAWKKEQ